MFINSVAVADVSIGAALSVPGCHSILCDGFCPRQAFAITRLRQSLKMSVQCCHIIALYGEILKSWHRCPSAIRPCSVEIVLQKYLFSARHNVNCPSGNLVLHNRIKMFYDA